MPSGTAARRAHQFHIAPSRRLATGICVAVAGTVHTTANAVALMSVALFLLYVTGALYRAVVQDVVHPARLGSVSGCMHCIGSLSGVIGPAVTGLLVQRSGSYASAFLLAGGIALAGALLSGVFIRDSRPREAASAKAYS